MAESNNLPLLNRLDLICSDDEDYTEEEFEKFLNKTKECLKKLTINERSPSIENVSQKDEGDEEFMQFLGTLKSRSKSGKSEQSFSHVASPINNSNLKDHSSILQDGPSKNLSSNGNVSASNLNLSVIDEKFEKMFSINRSDCAEELYKYFNQKIFENKLPIDMELEWSVDLRTTAGKTVARKKGNVYTSCKIILATKVLTTYDRLRDTLLHEMCHAAVSMISQISGDNHGPLWHTWAARCNLILPDINIPTRCHNYEISYPFYYKCNNCSWKCGRQKKSVKLAKALCPSCRNSLTLIKS